MDEKKVLKALRKYISNEEVEFNNTYPSTIKNILYKVFIDLYDKIPYVYQLYYPRGLSNNIDKNKGFYKYIEENKKNPRETRCFDWVATIIAMQEHYEIYIYRNNDSAIIFGPNFIIFDNDIFSINSELDDELKSCLKYKKPAETTFNLVCMGQQGIATYSLEAKDMGEFILNNYNDDIPDDRVHSILNDNSSSIIIFNGKPGCGKTSYIRSLIKDVKQRFYWLDPSMFSYINSSAFIDFILNTKNSVFILEDCETLLTSRELGNNNLLSSLLNISDGMLGDALHLKFICTFNTDLVNIDSALLRKGRLKLQYEFKELEKDKVKKIFTKLNINPELATKMPLCDVYNFNEPKNNSNKRKRVGF